MTRDPGAHRTAATVALVLVAARRASENQRAARQRTRPPLPARRACRQAAGAPNAPMAPTPGHYRMSPRDSSAFARTRPSFRGSTTTASATRRSDTDTCFARGESLRGGFTEAEALELFAKDVARIVDPALDRITVPLTQNQVDALGSFIYNVGPGNFVRSMLPTSESRQSRRRHRRRCSSTSRVGTSALASASLCADFSETAARRSRCTRRPRGACRSRFPGQEWSRAARRLLANGMQFLRVESACSLDICREIALALLTVVACTTTRTRLGERHTRLAREYRYVAL